jgi:hypothetical protein
MAIADNDPQTLPPPRSEDDKKLYGWAMALYKEGLGRRRHWEGIWWESIAVYMGDLWVEWDIHKRRLVEPVRRPDHRVRVPINLAQPVVRTELAKLTKNRPIIDVLARSSDQSDLNSAKVGDKVMNNYVESAFHMARVRRRMLVWALTCGIGGIIVDYDKTKLGEIEVLCDQGGNPIFDPQVIEAYKQQLDSDGVKPNYKRIPQGELIIKQVSPFQIIWDFSQMFIEDAGWCIYTDTYDIDEVYRRWGVHVSPDPHAIPGIIEQRLMGRFDYTGKLATRPVHVQKLSEIHQMWIKPGHPKFPDGLCLVFNKDGILDKTAFEYSHGELPVHMMGHVPFPMGPYAMSVIPQIKGAVLELSKTESQMMENRNLMANPPWLIPKQLQITKEIQNKPGARIEFNYMPNVPEPKPIEMPEMPKYVSDLITILKEHILEIGGQGETSQGRVPPGARSGVAIAYLQEEDDTRLGVTVQEFEETMEGVANHILKVIAEKYTTPRVVRIYKKHSDDEVFDFFGSMLDGCAAVNVQAGSALPRSKAAKQQYILDLWDRKLEQDPRKVRQMLELSEGEPDEWEIDLDQAERENHMLQNGQDPGVKEWYNHPAHHYVHRNYMKSADYTALSQDIQELFEQHDEEHTYYEQMQMQAASQPAQPQQGQNGSAPQGSSVPSNANGQNVPQGPPSQFTSATSPRSLLEAQPQ